MSSEFQVRRSEFRRGMALIDVVIGGVLLAVGLAVVISLATRALRTQTDAEKQLTASWLADELLSTVVVEGPIAYPKLYDTFGRFDWPFDEFEYDVNIQEQGEYQPYLVTAAVFWAGGRGERSVQVQASIAERGGDPAVDEQRIPLEPVDRYARWNPDEEQ